MESGRQALAEAFARLFDKTAAKLSVTYTPEEMAEAKQEFAERMDRILDVLDTIPLDVLPAGSLERMEGGIDALSPAQVVGQIATVPIMQHTQNLLQHLAYQAAEHRFVEQALEQADTSYGGN